MKFVQKNYGKVNSDKVCKIVIKNGKMVSHTTRVRRVLEAKTKVKA